MSTEHELLRSTPLFKDLPDDVVGRFVDIAEKRNCLADQIIFAECTEVDEIFMVLDGEVTVEAAFANADQQMQITTVSAGDFLALIAFVEEAKSTVPITAIAKTDATLLVWESAQWRRFCEQNPEAGYRLVMGICQILSQRLRMLNQMLLANVSWGLE